MAVNGPIWMDTWGWVALGSKDENRHRIVSQIYQGAIPGQIKTSNFILDETISLIFSRLPFEAAQAFVSGLLLSTEKGYFEVFDVTPSFFAEAWSLRLRYRDKPKISFTDFTSFTLMQENNIRHVVTADQHFRQAGMNFILLPGDLS